MSRDGRHLFTSESVTEGHPDKIADQISDSILDAILAQDSKSRVACETLVTTGLVVLAGEITTNAIVDFQEVARAAIRDVGYTRAKFGFDADTCAVLSSLHKQSPDISMGVDTGGAGDQGLMFGYACNETEELMPLPIMLAHKLVKGLSCARRDGVLDYLRPDGKSQVTVEYDGRKPVRVDAVVISSQHREDVTNDQMRGDIVDKIINRVVPASLMDENTKIYVNPTGRFVVGGPHGMRASPDARSSSTPTAAQPLMAAAHSRVKTPPRWIARRATWRATSRRISLRPASARRFRCSSRTRLASLIRFQ